MLKYLNNEKCNVNVKDPNKFNAKECNISLYDKINNGTEFLTYNRCLFMTFDEYTSDKVHINKNIYCRVFDTVNETAIKTTIQTELKNIKDNMLRPSGLKIPLPIYMMFAKKLENIKKEDVFNGNYTVVLYIPNLYNYNGEGNEYTLFPSLDAFSKQNRWMELMTSKYSKYLDIIMIADIKDKEDKIIKKNFFMTDLTQSCFNMGCVSSEKETFIIPAYSSKEAELSISVENISPYYPKRCLKTPYYNKYMMNFSKEDEERFRGSVDVLSEGFDVNLHCSEDNMKIYESKEKKDKETFDVFLCKQITACKSYTGEDPKYKNDYDKIICNNTDEGKVEILLSDFYRKYIKSGTDKENYSADYNNNILKELAFRKSKYPGPSKIQEIVFSMFQINDAFINDNESLFCYMPWGNILLKHDFVINDGDTLEIERVSFKSFNKVFEMKFNSDGFLYIYKNNQIHSQVPKQSGSFKCYTRRVLKFESMNLNVYGYDAFNNYDLRGFISIPLKSLYVSPASIILSNNGDLTLYDLGINKKTP